MALSGLRVDMAGGCGRILNAETATRGFAFLPGFPKTAYTFGRSEPAIVTGRNPATVSATEQWRAHFVKGATMKHKNWRGYKRDRVYVWIRSVDGEWLLDDVEIVDVEEFELTGRFTVEVIATGERNLVYCNSLVQVPPIAHEGINHHA